MSASSAGLVLGAPGVRLAHPRARHDLQGVRLDVAGIAGVAPRGPARDAGYPTPVESWGEYRRLFGGFEGPGRLPYAVSAFFEQGGRRAYVARIVPGRDRRPREWGAAVLELDPTALGFPTSVEEQVSPVRLRARDEGSWGDLLAVSLTPRTGPRAVPLQVAGRELVLPPDVDAPLGSLLRVTPAGGGRTLERFVVESVERPARGQRRLERVLVLDDACPADVRTVEVVDAVLEVTDRDPATPRAERHERLGLHRKHPRWIAAVLAAESALLEPAGALAAGDLPIIPVGSRPRAAASTVVVPGRDGYDEITHEDFFDDEWDPLSERDPRGVRAFERLPDVGLVVVPDLYDPAPSAPPPVLPPPLPTCGPTFAPRPTTARAGTATPSSPLRTDSVAGPVAAAPAELSGLRLDPMLPGHRRLIVDLQRRLVGMADAARQYVVLLDVPPGLSTRQVLAWRASFGSSYAAAYHPWLTVARADDPRGRLVAVPPSPFAAGIVAAREGTRGLPVGPANVVAVGALSTAVVVTPGEHDDLHLAGVNVFLPERDGARLTGARTLSADPVYRQLTVRRLLTYLSLTLAREARWLVFEPNSPSLRGEVRHVIGAFLGRLFEAGAFAGAREEESFFVRCDERVNDRASTDAGRLVAEIGVAPAAPLEYLILRLERDADGTVRVEDHGA